MERALHAVEQTAARCLILDIIGVPVVDRQAAARLIQVVQAARLLGANVVQVGVRPEMAQAVVGLGVSFGDIITCSTLQDGIAPTAGTK